MRVALHLSGTRHSEPSSSRLGSAISGTATRLVQLSAGVDWDHQKQRRQTARLLQRMPLFRRACELSYARADGLVVVWLATMPRMLPGSFSSTRILPTNVRCSR